MLINSNFQLNRNLRFGLTEEERVTKIVISLEKIYSNKILDDMTVRFLKEDFNNLSIKYDIEGKYHLDINMVTGRIEILNKI
jgi:hypothetical protein